ncbi:MAG TPA: DMT family transporter [Geminicoccaceae bacterium]|nr:DMT family transporter [Geminicoccaceae bacterium]
MFRWSSGTAPGIACIVAAMLALSLQDSLIKWLGASYALHQIVLTRSVIAAMITLAVLAAISRLRNLRTRRWRLHLSRGLLMIASNSFFFLGLIAMPVAEATAMFFVAPLFITLLSALLLGEPVGPRRLCAVLLGFAGVVIVVRPGSGLVGPVALLPVGAAATYAVMQIMTRRLGVTDSAATMAFWAQMVFVAASAAVGLAVGDGRFAGSGDPSLDFLLRAWHLPKLEDVPLFGLVGLLIAGASVLLFQAYRTTEAAAIAPFEYIALPFAAIWGFLFWGEAPDATALVGMGLIVGSGVFIVVRTERLRTGTVAPATPLVTMDEPSERSG